MKTAVYSARRYDQTLLMRANAQSGGGHELVFLQDRLDGDSAQLCSGCEAVAAFVNDDLGAPVLERLAAQGIRFVTTRSTGFNHIDIQAARRLGITVARVADYSPYSVAEFAVGLLLAVNRKIARASMRTREGNFELDGLMGFDLHGKTVGVIGTGSSGAPRGAVATAIEAINRARAADARVDRRPGVFAVDIPSGLDCDTGLAAGDCVRADATATFVARKIGFDAPGAGAFTGAVHVLDIGVPRRLLDEIAADG
jgi:lactate dehydrogenase-like 2-hydroxyacid dehydrogenase